MKFNDIVEKLRSEGFIVSVKENVSELYNYASISGKGVVGGFCTPHCEDNIDASYTYLNGKISADNEDCFDKWSKCPISLPFPKNNEEMSFLLDELEFLGSIYGYEKSNSYEYEHVGSYPSDNE